jgi:hypothetical protein
MGRLHVRRSLAPAVTRLGGVSAVLCAGMLLAPTTAHAAVVQQVQSGTAVNSANGTQTINISGVDPSKSFLIFETRHASNRPVGAQLRGRIPVACANPCTTIEFVRVTDEGAPAAINIQWYVVTFVSGVAVQRGEVAQSATAVDVTLGQTLSSVNQAFLLWSKTPTNTDQTWDDNDFMLGEIASTTTVQFRANSAAATHTIYWQVVEFTNPADATVQKGTIAGMTTAQTSVTATLGTAVDPNKTFVLVGYRAGASAATNMGALMLRADLTNSTTITIDRSTVGAPAVAISEIVWQAIELKDKSVVWNGSSNFAAASTQTTVALVPQVNTSRAIAFGTVQSGAGQNLGRSAYLADDIIGVGSATMALSSTQLTLTRNNTAAAADVGWTVVEFEQADAKVLSGSYLGNGADDRGIDVGFVPDFVIVKSDATQVGVFRSSTMSGDNSKLAVGATALVANHIQSFDATNGGRFVIGTDVRVNAAGTMYYWTAFKAGAGKMTAGTYTGNGAATQSISGLEFSPELVHVLPESAQDAIHRSTPSSNAFDFGTGAPDATWIPSLDAAGFTVGSDARVNANGVVYHYIAWNEVPGWMDVGTYTGNGAATQNITTVGFEPEYLQIRRDSGTFWTYNRPASLAGSTGDAVFVYDIFGQIAARVTQLLSSGFQVGNSTQLNNSGSDFVYHAWKRDSAPILLSGDYTGNGGTQAITGLGFQPDVVIVKTSTQVAQIRTSTMTAVNNTKPMTGATALSGSRVTSLDGTGFTVGNSATVNSNGTLYYFVAFKAAPGTMTVGTYTGNGLAGGQSITGVGFSPELVFIMGDNANEAVHRASAWNETHNFNNSLGDTTWVTSLDADGFTLGSNNSRVNAAGVTYHYIAWNAIPGEMVTNGYTGNGADARNITGVGFEPEYVILKQVDAQAAVHHPASLGRSVDSSLHFTTTANAANLIQALQPDGFQVGNDARVNSSGPVYGYYAWRRPYAAALTAVRLISFTATRAASGRTLIRWKTGWEVDNLGFHVYREVDGHRTRLTPSLVAGSALSLGRGVASRAERSYGWWDPNPGGPHVRYFLADLDLNGQTTWHGPISAQAGDVAETLANSSLLRETLRHASFGPQRAPAAIRLSSANSRATWPTAGRARGRATPRGVTGPALARQQEIAAGPAVKIAVRTAGWYRVGRSQLIAAGLEPSVDPRTLQLYVEGEELPIIVRGEEDGRFDDGDHVEFYGNGVDTPYTDTRVYWLCSGSQFGLRIAPPIRPGFAELRTEPPTMPTGFPSTVERKDRTTYFAALQNGEAENFFGEIVIAGEATPQTLMVTHVDRAAGVNGVLEVTLQGVTDEETAPDHRVAVVLNGVELGEVLFDGRAQGVAAFDVPHSLLLDGENVVALESRASEVDTSLVDRLRLTYQRTHDADGDALAFAADGGSLAIVRGFTNASVRVFDLTDAAQPVELAPVATSDDSSFTIEVRVPGTGVRHLVALTHDGFDAPPSISANQPSHWHQAGLAGSHVIVAHGSFIDSLAPLTALRESQGHAGALVDVEDLYDEFSFGEKTPFAIRDFLARAAAAWARPPEYLVLAGNATNDPRDYYELGEPDFVPTKLVATASLETASDDWFADADGDGAASIPVGRLPIRSAAEGTAIVTKIVSYEESADEPWNRNVLLVADENDPGADFEGLASRLGQLLPPGYSPSYVFRGQSGSHAASELLQQINTGQLIVNFAGHGSVDVWGRRADLMTSLDVANGWDNPSRLPFVVAMNCLNGFFHGLFPEESLAETLIRAQHKGAIAVWASSAVTETAAQASVNQRLFTVLFSGEASTIGAAALAAKLSVSDADLQRSWILFGDPALRLKGLPASPPPRHSVGFRPAPDAGDAALAAVARGERREDETDTVRSAGAVVPLRLADFGGDRRADVMLYNAQTGQWRAVLSDGLQIDGEWPANWQVAAGDFDGDRLLDVALYDPLTGAWFQARNEGLARFGYASGAWKAGGRLHVEDSNRDRRDDVFLADGSASDPARLFVGGATVAVGDFDADGREDYFLFTPATGAWTLALSRDGGRFDYAAGAWPWARGWTVVGK